MAPAPLPVLAGVVASVAVASSIVVTLLSNDWAAVIAFVFIIGAAAVVLNRSGQDEAERNPHPLYNKQKLPADGSTVWIRTAFITTTLVALMAWAFATAEPGENGSPLPYFFAVTVLFFVMPQTTARIAVRRAGTK